MKKLVWAVPGFLVVALLAYFLWSPKPQTDTPVSIEVDQANVSLQTSPIQAVKPTLAVVESIDDEFDPYEDAALQAQFLQVAELYEQVSKYPHFSQPITNPDAVKDPEPFEETEVDTPFPVDGLEDPIRLLAAVDRYQYFRGDTITVRLQVVGAPVETFVQAMAIVSNALSDTPLATQLTPNDESLTSFTGSFDTQIAPPGVLQTEMLLKLQVTIGEETLFTTVPFRYSEAAAQLVAIPYVRPEEEYLLIPLQYAVFSPGYYYANAILEDARSGQPLLQLQAEGSMSQGNGVLILKAHSHALKAAGSEGPYILRSIKTYRGAEDGETYDIPASSAQARFNIQGFSFDQYDDIPYQDDAAAERLEFLRNLGSLNNQNEEGQ